MKFLVQFSVHVPKTERKGLLQEIEDRYSTSYATRDDGIFEITIIRKSNVDYIKSHLTDEDNRGTLKFWVEE